MAGEIHSASDIFGEMVEEHPSSRGTRASIHDEVLASLTSLGPLPLLALRF
jgi:hypothetical protein